MPPTKDNQTSQFRWMGNYPYEVVVGDNPVQVGLGDFVDLTADDLKNDHNKELKSSGLLVKVDTNE